MLQKFLCLPIAQVCHTDTQTDKRKSDLDSLLFLVCVSWTIIGQWSATKQRLHPQSAAEISCHSVLSGDKFDNVRHRLGLATRTQISVCKSPFPSAGTAVSLFRAKMVSRDHCCRGRSKPVAGLWGRIIGESWPPGPTSSYASIDFWCQLVASPATAASWMSVVAISIVKHIYYPL